MYKDGMRDVVDMITRKFGTQARWAEAIGATQSTVAYWKIRDNVPSRAIQKTLAAAKREGIDLSPADFFTE
jgi:DNA-binding transcriptional regulator YiaG